MISISSYLEYPYGKGSAFNGGAKDKIKDLKKEFEVMKEKMSHNVFLYNNHKLIFHIIVPSNSDPALSYDVIIEMDKEKNASTYIKDEKIKVFSNCPSFVYTYAYAFKSRGLTCNWLGSKYSKVVKSTAATTRNAYNVVGLERSLYLACLYIVDKNFTDMNTVNCNWVKVSSYHRILASIRTDSEISSRRKAKKTTTEVISVDKQEKETDRYGRELNKGKSKSTMIVKSTKSNKCIGTSKKNKTTKSIKKI